MLIPLLMNLEMLGLNNDPGGDIYIPKEIIRPKSIKDILDVAMADIYEAGTDKSYPLETRESFAKIVKPFTKSKAKIPDVDKIDWKTFEDDITRIEQMIALWEQVLDDEEVIIMSYLNYYH